MTSEELNKIMPWIVALLIGVLTTIVNIVVMRKNLSVNKDIAVLNFNSNVLSRNRQDWINILRESMSEYLATFDFITLMNELNSQENIDVRFILTEEGKKQIRNLFYLQNKIGLLLNIKEEKSRLLYKNLLELTAAFDKDKDNNKYYQDKANYCLVTCQDILKEEWVRVKTGK